MNEIKIKKKTLRKGFNYLALGLLLLLFLLWLTHTNNYDSRDNFDKVVPDELNNEEKVVNFDYFDNISELHWGEVPITYKFENNNTERQLNLTRDAFNRIEKETGRIVRFEEVEVNPDISIYFKPTGSGGELTLGDARMIDVDESKNLILKGEINFYGQGFVCNTGYPQLEVHEILHLFNIPHNPLLKSIMSPYSAESSSRCQVTKIDSGYISCLRYIYSNGVISGSCDFPNVVKEGNMDYFCNNGWYPVEGTNYCCPEPNMKIVEGYCEY